MKTYWVIEKTDREVGPYLAEQPPEQKPHGSNGEYIFTFILVGGGVTAALGVDIREE